MMSVKVSWNKHEQHETFNRDRDPRSLVFCVVFCESLFVFLSFSCCIVCPSILMITPSLYLQILLGNGNVFLSYYNIMLHGIYFFLIQS